MSRITLEQVEAAAKYVTEITGQDYKFVPTGSGFYDWGYMENDKFVSIANRPLFELPEFIEGYRRGYGKAANRDAFLRVVNSNISYDVPKTTLRVPVKLTGKSKMIRGGSISMNREIKHVEITVVGSSDPHWVDEAHIIKE